jgi:hypothetical protein
MGYPMKADKTHQDRFSKRCRINNLTLWVLREDIMQRVLHDNKSQITNQAMNWIYYPVWVRLLSSVINGVYKYNKNKVKVFGAEADKDYIYTRRHL